MWNNVQAGIIRKNIWCSDIMELIYFVKGAPATNNGVENYYSTSLKTHRKKQLRTDRGIEILDRKLMWNHFMVVYYLQTRWKCRVWWMKN